jgi:hypothetical protein
MDIDGDADACGTDGAGSKKDSLADGGSVTDGLVYSAPYAEAQNALNPDVTAAIARFRDVDPHSLDQLQAAITTHAGDFAEPPPHALG